MGRRAFGGLFAAGALVLLTGASTPARPVSGSGVATAPAPASSLDSPAPPSSAPPNPAPAERREASGPCPADMAYVAGLACSEVEQTCLEWLPRLPGSPPRCGRFAPNPACSGETAPMRFCIDQFEYPNARGELPRVDTTWDEAASLCAARGKRLCKSKEWTLACEGESRLPYPYGYERDETACNVDRPMLGPFPRPVIPPPKQFAHMPLVDWRVPSGDMNRCVSPFGVHDMTGNVDEWVMNESGKPYASGLKGGYWGPVRDRCRPMTVAHGQRFSFYQIGFRCCADIP